MQGGGRQRIGRNIATATVTAPRSLQLAAVPEATLAWVALTLGLLLCLWPLLQTATPPIVDYPNHLARAYILAEWGRFSQFEGVYEFGGLVIPNILADLVTVGLVKLVGPFEAGRLLLALLMALLLSGAFAVSAAIWRPSAWPALIVPFLYNESFYWGFLNYLLGLGLLFWGCAAWLFLERKARRWQLLAGTLFGLAIFFSHLVAFALFGLAIGLLELRHVWKDQGLFARASWLRLMSSAAIFVPPLCLFLLISPSGGLDLAPQFNFSAYWKLSPYTRLLASGNPGVDVAVLVSIVLLVSWLLVTRRLVLHGGLAVVAAVFILLALVLPHSAMGSFYLDDRIPIAAVMIGLLALRPRRSLTRSGMLLCAAVAGLVVLRMGVIAADWREADQHYAAQLEAFESLPEGGLVVAVAGSPFESKATWLETRTVHPPHEHTAHYATMVSDSVVLHLFAKRGHNPVILEPDAGFLLAKTRETIPFLPDRNALARFTQALRSGAARDPVYRERPLYVAAFRIPCARWPDSSGVRREHCGDGLSIIQLPDFPQPAGSLAHGAPPEVPGG